MSFFTVRNLSAGYGKTQVLRDCTFSLQAGEVTAVLAANGAGKTTLLRAVCGILPHGGSCTLDGVRLESLSVRETARRIGYIPQRSGISVDIPVLDVVLMGFHARLGLLGQPDAGMRRAAMEAIAQVGLAGRENENYQTLSEGQRQLCILARTLVTGCCLYVLDEPESALDFRLRHRMLSLLSARVHAAGGAALMALHDPMLALNSCDRILILDGGVITGDFSPNVDPAQDIEAHLRTLYGPLSLMRCRPRGRTGAEQWVMLREDGIHEQL